MRKEEYWIWISKIHGVTNNIKLKLLETYKTPEKLWNASIHEMRLINGINKNDIKKLRDENNRKNLEKYLVYMQKNNIKMITYQDKDYPIKLQNINDKPIVIYVKGNEKILNQKSVAIIGCRKASIYRQKDWKKIGI